MKLLLKTLTIFLAAGFLWQVAGAQDLESLPPPESSSAEEPASWEGILLEKVPANLPLSSALYQIGRYHSIAPNAVQEKVGSMGLLSNGKKVNAEILYRKEDVTREDATIDEGYLSTLGIEVSSTWRNRASIWLTPEEILPLAQKLKKDYFLSVVFEPRHDDQGPTNTNSDDYSTSGNGGSGITIAVLDAGYDSLTEARNQNVAPPASQSTSIDYVGSGMQSGSRHGTGCLETVYDHAPSATYRLYRIGNLTDMGNAVNDAEANGVDVISHSLSRYNTGWDDGTGAACAAAADAANGGILFFTSAGNRANQHWQGNWSNPDTDGWHNFNGGDEGNNVNSVDSSGRVFAYLSWDNSGSGADYDLFLYNASTNNPLASSTGSGSSNFESLGWTSQNDGTNVFLSVQNSGSSTPEFELFMHPGGPVDDFQYADSTGSTTSPSNSLADNVVSVGATNRWNYNNGSGTYGIQAGYSSQGPTNSNNQAPDVSAPTATTTITYGGNFGGTSCSTPNAAGVAAAFWGKHQYMSAEGVREILFRKAHLFKDWGNSGADQVYGHGGLYLYDYEPLTRYVWRGAGNTTGTNDLPYYYLDDAQQAVASGGRILILGGSYPEPILLDKSVFIISLKENAEVGD